MTCEQNIKNGFIAKLSTDIEMGNNLFTEKPSICDGFIQAAVAYEALRFRNL